ncbi:MAG: ACT domain-containing protein [Nitriliruptoraceae bacterium]
MRKDLVIIPDDQPGQLARLGEVLGAAGINIEAISAFTGQGKGIVHVLVDRAEDAIGALEDAGLEVRAARRVVVVPLPDEPGHLGAACRTLADAGVNIEQAYIAAGYKLVVVCDDVDRAKQLLGVQDA